MIRTIDDLKTFRYKKSSAHALYFERGDGCVRDIFTPHIFFLICPEFAELVPSEIRASLNPPPSLNAFTMTTDGLTAIMRGRTYYDGSEGTTNGIISSDAISYDWSKLGYVPYQHNKGNAITWIKKDLVPTLTYKWHEDDAYFIQVGTKADNIIIKSTREDLANFASEHDLRSIILELI